MLNAVKWNVLFLVIGRVLVTDTEKFGPFSVSETEKDRTFFLNLVWSVWGCETKKREKKFQVKF